MLTFPKTQPVHRARVVLAAFGLLLFFSFQGVAQSGRRTSKPIPPAPPETSETDVARTTAERMLTSRVSLIVGRQPTSKHLLSEDAITANFVKQLSNFDNVDATSVGNLNRDRAVKRARSETAAFVVLLQFDIDSFQNGTIILNSPDLDVRVLVFEPLTGREKFKGKVYYKAVGGPMMKKDNWPNGTPIRITTEAVGIEAAEQVRDWLIVQEMNRKPWMTQP